MSSGQSGQSPWTTIGIGDQLVALAGWWKRGARWNDTITGTWTTADPLTVLNDPGRANPYAYVGDDPVNSFDPSGRGWWDDVVSTAGRVAGDAIGCIEVGAVGATYGGIAGSLVPVVGNGVGAAAGAIGGCAVGILSIEFIGDDGLA